MTMIKNLFVLDIDDTLTASEFQHQSAYVETMKYFGIKDINENWSTYQHMTDSYILKKNYEANLDQAFSFEFVQDFENKMTEAILKLNPVKEINGAKKTIRHILDHGDFGICLATGSFLKPALLKLQQADIPVNHQLVVGSNAHFTREEIVQQSINLAKDFYKVSDFQHIISVGDGLWDWQTAQNLGIHFIGIGTKNKRDFQTKNIAMHINDWNAFNLLNALDLVNTKP